MSVGISAAEAIVKVLNIEARVLLGSFPRSFLLNEFLIVTFYSWGGVRLIPLGRLATLDLLHKHGIIDEYGAVGGMRIDRGNRNTRRKTAPVSLCLPQIPHDLTWVRTQGAAVGS
jgi:hypothetical protein